MSLESEARDVAVRVKAGQQTSYDIEALADYVLALLDRTSGVTPVEPVAPAAVDSGAVVEGADVPPAAPVS